MMGLRKITVCVVIALTASCAVDGGDPAPQAPMPVDAAETREALAVLKRMSDFLAGVEEFRFSADVRYDAVQESGQKIEFGNERHVAIRRPDRARVEVIHWYGAGEALVYDGGRLSMTIPNRAIYASLQRTGPLADALDYLLTEHGVPTPLADLLHPELYSEVADRVTHGVWIGQATLDGVACDHLAFRSEDVDFQLFIRSGDQPLPLRLVIDYRNAEGKPQFRASLRDWELSPDLPEEFFRFAPAAGSQRVSFHELLDLMLETDGRAER
jgi:hypothetical protein